MINAVLCIDKERNQYCPSIYVVRSCLLLHIFPQYSHGNGWKNSTFISVSMFISVTLSLHHCDSDCWRYSKSWPHQTLQILADSMMKHWKNSQFFAKVYLVTNTNSHERAKCYTNLRKIKHFHAIYNIWWLLCQQCNCLVCFLKISHSL